MTSCFENPGRFPLLGLFSLLWLLGPLESWGQDADRPPPSFLFILTDDQGWTGSSLQMDPAVAESRSAYYETPRLEALAAQGMTFSQAYAPSPQCSPTRISLLTGKSPQQLGLTYIVEGQKGERYDRDFVGHDLLPPPPIAGLPEAEVTVAEALKALDPRYVTGHLGKWHVEFGDGARGPGGHGFDVHTGATGHGLGSWNNPDPKRIFGLTQKAKDFLGRRAEDERPFYLQVSHYAVHVLPEARAATKAKYEAKDAGPHHDSALYAAMTEDLDTGIGMLLDELDRLGLAENTYVFLFSDNGGSKNVERAARREPENGEAKEREAAWRSALLAAGQTDNWPLRGGKTQVWEGGIRVPFIARGPGIEPGSRCAVPVIGWDFYPTILALAGAIEALPEGVEGGSLVPLLLGDGVRSVDRPREELVWHFPHYVTVRGTRPQSALRLGDYKLVKHWEGPQLHLYDLSRDLGEERDLAAELPEKTEELHARMQAYLRAVGARLPEPGE